MFIGRPIFSNGLPLLLLSPTGDERGGGGRKGGPYLSSSNTSCVDLISKLFLLPFPLSLPKNPPTYPRVEWEKDGKQFFLRPPWKTTYAPLPTTTIPYPSSTSLSRGFFFCNLLLFLPHVFSFRFLPLSPLLLPPGVERRRRKRGEEVEMSPGHGKNTSTEKGKARDGGGKRKKKKEMGDISRACFFFPLLLSPASLTFSPPPSFLLDI